MHLCETICAAWTSRYCFARFELVETTVKVSDMKTLRLTNDLYRRTFRRN